MPVYPDSGDVTGDGVGDLLFRGYPGVYDDGAEAEVLEPDDAIVVLAGGASTL